MKQLFSSSTSSLNMEQELKNIIKEDTLLKESKILKSQRERWTVLTKNALFTFKERRVYKSPTESIELKRVVGIRSVDCDANNMFIVQTHSDIFVFRAINSDTKQQWISSINSAIIKCNSKGDDD